MRSFANLVDDAMEATVVPGFSRIGYAVRRKLRGWAPPGADMTGRVVVLTGGTSGIGAAAGRTLVGLGAHVLLAGRDRERGEAAARAANDAPGASGRAEFAQLDVGDLNAVRRFAGDVEERFDGLDGLVHNAGALLPERRETAAGIEVTLAVHLLGPYVLTEALRPTLAAAGGRVIWMSSGGMYTTPLVLDQLEAPEEGYDGRTAYARVKRAQVVLAQLLGERYAPDGITVHAMHPGWVDTPGVDAGIPLFGAVMAPILRTPEQGADTLVWLVSDDKPVRSTGAFWHDRRRRSMDKLGRTRVPEEVRTALIPWIEKRIDDVDDR
jgi:dehydrogenase/reductase SDR family protein 12